MPAPLQPAVTAQIVDSLAAGQSHREVGRLLGIDRSTVTKRAKSMRPMIEAQALDYFEANTQLATLINSQCLQAAQILYNTIPPTELSAHAPILNQAHKISDRILQSVGIAPSLAPSVTVQQFISVTGNTIIAPDMAKLFSPASLAQIAPPDEAIDAEWSEMADEDGG